MCIRDRPAAVPRLQPSKTQLQPAKKALSFEEQVVELTEQLSQSKHETKLAEQLNRQLMKDAGDSKQESEPSEEQAEKHAEALAVLQAQVSEHQQQVEALTADRSKLQDDLDGALGRLEGAVSQESVRELEAAAAQREARTAELEAQLAAATSTAPGDDRTAELETQLMSKAQRTAELEAQLAAATSTDRTAELEVEVEELQRLCEEWKGKLEAADTELGQGKQKWDAERAELEANLQAEFNERRKFEEELAAAKSATPPAAAAAGEGKTLHTEAVKRLETRLKQAQAEAKTAAAQLAEKESECVRLQSGSPHGNEEHFKQQLAAAAEEKIKLTDKHSALRKDFERQKMYAKGLDSEKDALRKKLQGIEKERDDTNDNLKKARDKSLGMQKEIDKYKKQELERRSKGSSLGAKVAQLEAQLEAKASLLEEKQELESRVDILQQGSRKWKDKCGTLQREVDRHKSQAGGELPPRSPHVTEQALLKAKNESKRWKIKSDTVQAELQRELAAAATAHDKERADLQQRLKTQITAKEVLRHAFENQTRELNERLAANGKDPAAPVQKKHQLQKTVAAFGSSVPRGLSKSKDAREHDQDVLYASNHYPDLKTDTDRSNWLEEEITRIKTVAAEADKRSEEHTAQAAQAVQESSQLREEAQNLRVHCGELLSKADSDDELISSLQQQQSVLQQAVEDASSSNVTLSQEAVTLNKEVNDIAAQLEAAHVHKLRSASLARKIEALEEELILYRVAGNKPSTPSTQPSAAQHMLTVLSSQQRCTQSVSVSRAVYQWRQALSSDVCESHMLTLLQGTSPGCERCTGLLMELAVQRRRVTQAEELLADEMMKTEYEWCQREQVILELTQQQPSKEDNELQQMSVVLLESTAQEIAAMTTMLQESTGDTVTAHNALALMPDSPQHNELAQLASDVDASARALRGLVRTTLAELSQARSQAASTASDDLMHAARQAHKAMQDKLVRTRALLDREKHTVVSMESQNVQLSAEVSQQRLRMVQLQAHLDALMAQNQYNQPRPKSPAGQTNNPNPLFRPTNSERTPSQQQSDRPVWFDAGDPNSETLNRILRRQEAWLSQADATFTPQRLTLEHSH
eukprot:TRINITY_DN3486_c0_g1_i3.p1 TRINITY_DN3486_c0_g1~~TRINITY_DN3486_c0_g1_i3.p1  ORF type:complete len:1100 (+),score=425.75 TRINITY_DN3486_c0_g1_i3:88-3387(+)